jgi:ADP-ribose pyrophosphatase
MYERTLSSERVFSGRILSLDLLEVELEDGTRAQREIVRHRGAVGAVCRKSDGDFIFVRQFRKAIGDYCLEVVAGLLEADEDPSDCARREVMEETGYAVARLVKLAAVTLSPGYSSEYIHLFYAELDPVAGGQQLDDGEHVELVELAGDEFDAMLARGEVLDGKTLAAWLLYEKRTLGEEL